MLERIVYGWEHLEPALLASVALGWPVVLEGRHGLAKSTVVRAIAKALGEECRVYVAPVEDLLSVAGIPNPKKLAEGILEFTPHERAIWDAGVIVIDELPRGPKETQSMFLEVLQEHTLLGKPLQWRAALATMNPETYAASYRLDPALGDRYVMVLPVPEHQDELDEEGRIALLTVALGDQVSTDELAERLVGLSDVLAGIRDSYTALALEGLLERAIQYVGRLVTLYFASGGNVYISPRRQAMVAKAIMGITAARAVLAADLVSTTTGSQLQLWRHRIPADQLVEPAARDALLYTLCVPLGIEWEALAGFAAELLPILQGSFGSDEQFRYQLAVSEPAEKLNLIASDPERFLQVFEESEREKVLGEILGDEKIDRLLVWDLMSVLPGHDEARRRVQAEVAQSYDRGMSVVERSLGAFKIGGETARARAEDVARLLERYRQPPVTRAMLEAVLSIVKRGQEITCAQALQELAEAAAS